MSRENNRRGRGRRAFLGTLAAGLAHEIKNPLSAMSINLQMLREDLESDESRDRRLLRRVELLEREVTRLERILADFQKFARGFTLDLKAAPVNPMLREIVEFWAEGAKTLGIEVELVLGSDLPDVQIDTTYLPQAILNLLINAQEAIAGRGPDQREDIEGQILLGSRLGPGGSVEILVIDTGPGIESERLSKIFEPYHSSKGTGSGLGLAASKQIVEAHRGTLTVESELGRGTSFCIRLPPPGGDKPAKDAEGAATKEEVLGSVDPPAEA